MDIWRRLRLLLYPSGNGKAISAPRRNTDARPDPAGPGLSPGATELEREFIGLLLGAHSFVDIDLNGFERKALKALESLNAADLANSSLVPKLPGIVLELFNYAPTGAESGHELTRRIKQDQILAKEIIRAANSPYYRSRDVVKTLEQTVSIHGHDRVRRLAALVSFKPVFNMRSGHFGPLAAPRLWAQSERCAIACDCLARAMHIDGFPAFLAGLTSNTGLYLGARILDKVSDGTQSPHSVMFRQRFLHQCRLLSIKVARHWSVHNTVVDMLSRQVGADDFDSSDMPGSILFAGEKLSQLRVLVEAGRVRGDFGRFACRSSGALVDSCALCYAELEKFSGGSW